MLEDLANLLRKARGPCPSEDLLARYSRGVLDPDATGVLRSHIELCGVCEAWLKRTRDVERAVSEAPAEPAAYNGWDSVEERLRTRIRKMTS